MDVGGVVSMNVTFLSPLTPQDYMRHSLVFSYLNIDVQATDGNTHSVQLYADTSAGKSLIRTALMYFANCLEWVAGDNDSKWQLIPLQQEARII
jgi:hypothetical protein